jgi:hypothetical protein
MCTHFCYIAHAFFEPELFRKFNDWPVAVEFMI